MRTQEITFHSENGLKTLLEYGVKGKHLVIDFKVRELRSSLKLATCMWVTGKTAITNPTKASSFRLTAKETYSNEKKRQFRQSMILIYLDFK